MAEQHLLSHIFTTCCGGCALVIVPVPPKAIQFAKVLELSASSEKWLVTTASIGPIAKQVSLA